jgi:hypothetical protein
MPVEFDEDALFKRILAQVNTAREHAVDNPWDATQEDMTQALMGDFARAALVGPRPLLELFDEREEELERVCKEDPRVVDMLVACLQYGAAKGAGECANELGAFYYLGSYVEQNYEKAEQYYELAAELGCIQGMVNLGYIYEYGRVGEPDLAHAFECYVIAATLGESAEALYKLGDMYARPNEDDPGDLGMAAQFWHKSLETSSSMGVKGQAAFRLANIMIDEAKAEEAGLDFDPSAALMLYQAAELGIREDLEDGAVFYKERLKQAIAG